MKISPSFLEKTILAYKRQDIDFLSLDEVAERLEYRNESQHPFIAFTIDDGYIDNYTTAYPIFKKYNIPFTIYVATDFPDQKAILWWYILEDYLIERNHIRLGNGEHLSVDTPSKKISAFMHIRNLILKFPNNDFVNQLMALLKDYNFDPYSNVKTLSMSWEHISQISKDPLCTIGGHTATHPAFSRLTENEIYAEIDTGCSRLSEHTGKSTLHFAYPYGIPDEVTEREFLIAEKMNFKTMATAFSETVKQDSNLKHLPRTMLCEL